MGIGDYLTLRFFWEVRDEGSWLEIGESISMFVIASVLCVFVAGLEALSELFVRGVEFRDQDVDVNADMKGSVGKGVMMNGNAKVKSNSKTNPNGSVTNGSLRR